MEATPLWKILQGLCYDFHCDYAVLWKLQQGQMFLKWEEGYCRHPTLRESMESQTVDMGFSIADPIFSSTSGSSRHNGYSSDFPVGISLDDIASAQYHLGEGVVGKVALTGNHSWILSEDLSACDFESNVVPECPEEWLLQFAMGIKTIVLIPVDQHGVLQIGLSKKVGEDPMLVALVRDKFNAYLKNMNVLPTSGVEFQTKTPSSSISKLNQDGLSVNTIWNSCCISGETKVDNGVIMRENDISYQFVGLDEVFPMDHGIVPETMDITMIGSSIVEEDMKPLSYPNYNYGIFGEDFNVEAKLVEPFLGENTDSMTNINSLFSMIDSSIVEEDMRPLSYSDYNFNIFGEDIKLIEAFVDKNTDGMPNINSLFSFPMDCELHKVLGPTFQRPSNGHLWDPAIANEDSRSSSSELLNKNLIQGNEPSCLSNRDDEKHVLEAVHATMDSYLNDDLFRESNDARSPIESLGQISASAIECASEKMGVRRSSVTISTPKAVVTHSPPPFSTENILSTLTNEQKLEKGYKHPKTKKGPKVHKKRAVPGKSPRPRPRDRQLIQDRVKELRDLVPNGSKCSIDGLLDRTIKHMLFLRDVSVRAGKLRHWVNQEVTSQKKTRLSSPKADNKNGTSWAFELGSDFQVCPIIVKDLERPGHMLIEMLCNDTGLFLEIAEVIRRLNLTILKGVMESRANNTWSHFIVEVSKGFQRLDIFWPLMQLLQKDRTPVLD